MDKMNKKQNETTRSTDYCIQDLFSLCQTQEKNPCIALVYITEAESTLGAVYTHSANWAWHSGIQ